MDAPGWEILYVLIIAWSGRFSDVEELFRRTPLPSLGRKEVRVNSPVF
jgi:hypothetical protein